ncbi:branched-chain-amino-acid aminotransferase-like protein 2 [Salvia hispanica]|uniref:branched-chain-amino-acid aminotransferase-like protein 2 n=1 Tax=Salvia hispanica TaxID=49212 RepID=UPI002009B59E|nr:branched-chain-amino-acid aminotransferase-like protein 2 [Salvia hispanica]
MVKQEVEVIHLWSSPRSFSTSLMYAFAQRDDTEVLDEPLYANYLQVTGEQTPYREELLSKWESDGNKVIQEIIFAPGEKKYRFVKLNLEQRQMGANDFRWESGPKPFDGVWPFPSSMYNLLDQSLPLYNLLRCYIRGSSNCAQPELPVSTNEKLLLWVGDQIMPRESAKVSVFDSIVQGGDGVWEGLRIYNGKIFKLEEHLDRLFDSAKALAFSNVPTREQVKEAIFKTLIKNEMFNNVHVRLTLTRGKKVTSGMSPTFNQYGCTLIVLAEWKPPVYDNEKGIVLVTATTRRNSPNNLDSKIHHNNLLNNILAKIEGNNAHADDAIMLDKDGYVSETNATNIFLVKKGCVATPHSDYCLPGVTRATVIDLAVNENLVMVERRISLSEFHTADEVFTTGTMGELSPVSYS